MIVPAIENISNKYPIYQYKNYFTASFYFDDEELYHLSFIFLHNKDILKEYSTRIIKQS